MLQNTQNEVARQFPTNVFWLGDVQISRAQPVYFTQKCINRKIKREY